MIERMTNDQKAPTILIAKFMMIEDENETTKTLYGDTEVKHAYE